MRNIRYRMLRAVVGVLVAGTLFQLGGCSPQDALAFIKDFNPCGTILVCDPVSYRFLTSGYKGPGVDPDVDPACTYPPFCDNDPFAP